MLFFFFFNDTATTEIYTLSLHDALPIWRGAPARLLEVALHGLRHVLELDGAVFYEAELHGVVAVAPRGRLLLHDDARPRLDRKSTRLNSSHANISYAVFCLKKKT